MMETFGCERCWPSSADAAWKARSTLTHEADLIDESHFHIMILKCPWCSQRFVSVFTETIDWVDGEDPQYWTILPITRDEAAGLIKEKGALSESTFSVL